MNYGLIMNPSGEIEIVSGDKRNVIGPAHRLSMPSAVPACGAAMLRKANVNPRDYCWCNGRAIRNSHRAELEKMIAARRAEYATTPAGMRERRRAMAERIRAAAAEAADARACNFHMCDSGDDMGRNEFNAKAESASSELADFDAAHPEIKAGIEAEKAAATARNFWN